MSNDTFKLKIIYIFKTKVDKKHVILSFREIEVWFRKKPVFSASAFNMLLILCGLQKTSLYAHGRRQHASVNKCSD